MYNEENQEYGMKKKTNRRNTLMFLLLLGIVSMLSDFTHEGARSIYGPFLAIIGGSAVVVAFSSGLGEFIGQALRIATGIIADKTKKYWTMMILGYAINLLAIPMLALVGDNGWMLAVGLILLERIGKSIRAPAKSTLTSFAGSELGTGKAFAINEALDQIGAFLGPFLVFILLSVRSASEPLDSYRLAFGLLGIVAVATLTVLVIAKMKYPHPESIELSTKGQSMSIKNRIFWMYMAGIGLIAAGFIDYPIIAFHFGKTNAVPIEWIPLLYAGAMGVDALSALFFGWLFDKKGLYSLVAAISISMLFAPLLFLFSEIPLLIAGIVCWGIGMGAQESILKSVIASIVAKEKRATAYGVMNAMFGLCWFLGSLLVGVLYDVSINALVVFSVIMQLSSIPFMIIVQKQLEGLRKESV